MAWRSLGEEGHARTCVHVVPFYFRWHDSAAATKASARGAGARAPLRAPADTTTYQHSRACTSHGAGAVEGRRRTSTASSSPRTTSSSFFPHVYQQMRHRG
eukprot:6195669-Pleurochrysis_carterae.AAC.1